MEALLLYGLLRREAGKAGTVALAMKAVSWKTRPPNAIDLEDRSWDLFSYATVTLECKLIGKNTQQVIAIRDFRNLIHPAKARREKMVATLGTAQTGIAAISLTLDDLRNAL